MVAEELRLAVTPGIGTSIETAAREAHRLAVTLRVAVCLTFNGERLVIRHDTDPAKVVRAYCAMTGPEDTPQSAPPCTALEP